VSPTVLSKSLFVAELLAIAEGLSSHDTAKNADDPEELRLGDLGFDSGAVIEVVIFIEDHGVPMPDDLPWMTISIGELYAAYVAAAFDAGFQ
jgi:acyl carrier protein